MLIGEFYHTIDAKGRLIIPSKFRTDLGENFIVTKGVDNCLAVYPLSEWEILKAKIDSLPLSKGRDLQRHFYSGACEAEFDKQGRIVIPQNLREYAFLEKDVVIAGVSARAEIWNSERWEKINKELSSEKVLEIIEEIDF
jgi:MraZ protein